MRPICFYVALISLFGVLLLPSESEGAREPTPGRYRANLGDSGSISFRIDRSRRTLSRVAIQDTFTNTSTDGNVTAPVFASFRSGKRRLRIKARSSFDFALRNEEGATGIVSGRMRGRRSYQLLVQIFTFQPVALLDPDTGEPVGTVVSGASSGPRRPRARLVR